MERRSIALITATLLLIITAGCAPLTHLNDPARSQPARDVANLLAAREIPYETQERGGIAVSYNIMHAASQAFTGYRLTLIFRNTGSAAQVITPQIRLQDATGLIVPPSSYEAVMTQAAVLAGTPVTPYVAATPSTAYYHTGTIRSMTTGSTLHYSGQTTSMPSGGFAGGMASGIAQGAALSGARARQEGQTLLRWANSYYLKSRYQVPPQSAVAGALLFPAAHVGPLPLKLTIEAGGEKFEFLTARQ